MCLNIGPVKDGLDHGHRSASGETAPLVGAGDRLALCPGGLDVLRSRDALRMQLT
jgi:hypothetical protein